MADFERRELEIELEFRRSRFAKRNNFSEGSSEPKKYAQVIRVWGAAVLVFSDDIIKSIVLTTIAYSELKKEEKPSMYTRFHYHQLTEDEMR